MKRVSVKMIAERTNLSPGTVSIILNGRAREMRISEETEKRVLEEARKLGYKPNIYARRLRQQTDGKVSTVIGVLWPSLYSSELLVRFFDGLHTNILEKNMDVEIVFKPYKYSELYKLEEVFRDNFYNGVIIVGASDKDIEYLNNEKTLMPIVFFNRQSDRFGSVCLDDYNVGRMVAELFSARGHKRAGIIESNLLMRHLSMRRIGFLDGCLRYGIEVSEEHIIQETMDVVGGKRAIKKILESKEQPTALFFSMPAGMVNGAYEVLNSKGIKIPEDVEIVGYGDTITSEMLDPTLTVIDLPVQNMVIRCIQLITEIIKGQVDQSVTVFEKTYFIFRESCGDFSTKWR